MEPSSTKRQQLEILPTLPFDLVADIFSRLPVNLLLQLRCLSKSFNSLISDSTFAKDHLKSSTHRHRLMVSARELLLLDSPISSVFSTCSTLTQITQLNYPITPKNFKHNPPFGFSSCDGILCFDIDQCHAVLWNPSIRKFKLLPALNSNSKKMFPPSMYSFGYHRLRDSYMTIGISFCVKNQIEVSVNTMGTDYWRRIHDFPCHGFIYGLGVFLNGNVNWLTRAFGSSLLSIVSLDLEKESYQKYYMPDLNLKKVNYNLGLVRDCLCISEWNDTFLNVWIMKEYENKESWTKLYNIPLMEDHVLCPYNNDLYISEDDQLLVKFYEMGSKKLKLFIYDSKDGTWKIPEIQNINYQTDSKVYIESLISPCS